jgi:hypothetical protein
MPDGAAGGVSRGMAIDKDIQWPGARVGRAGARVRKKDTWWCTGPIARLVKHETGHTSTGPGFICQKVLNFSLKLKRY